MLVASMRARRQNLIWISDDDAIAPNREKLFEATRIVGHYLNHYFCHNLAHIRLGTAGNVDPGDRQAEDLVALSDLSAGALAEMLTLCWRNVGTGASKILLPSSSALSDKAKLIGNWIAENEHPLRKLVVLVEGTGQSYKTKIVNLLPERPSVGRSPFDWRIEVDQHLKGRILALMGRD